METKIDWEIYNAAETTSVESNQEELFSDIDVSIEITAVDTYMVKTSFAGNTLAGEEITYSFNRYGQLQATVGKTKAKGQLLKGICMAIFDSRAYFQPDEELSVNSLYTIVRGTLFPNGSKIPAGILLRGNRIIGIYKSGTDLSRTIKWYEQTVYKSNAWQNMHVHKVRDYRPEFRLDDDVYAQQTPEFTREDELQEIHEFISSLKGRKLSVDEQLLLQDIRNEIDSIAG